MPTRVRELTMMIQLAPVFARLKAQIDTVSKGARFIVIRYS